MLVGRFKLGATVRGQADAAMRSPAHVAAAVTVAPHSRAYEPRSDDLVT